MIFDVNVHIIRFINSIANRHPQFSIIFNLILNIVIKSTSRRTFSYEHVRCTKFDLIIICTGAYGNNCLKKKEAN